MLLLLLLLLLRRMMKNYCLPRLLSHMNVHDGEYQRNKRMQLQVVQLLMQPTHGHG